MIINYYSSGGMYSDKMGKPVHVLRKDESNVTINITGHKIADTCFLSLSSPKHCISIEPAGLYDAVHSFLDNFGIIIVDPTDVSPTPTYTSPTRKYQYIGITILI